MANVNRTNGLRPVKHLTGAPFNGQFTTYYIRPADTTPVFIGDLVKLDGGSDGKGVRSVAQAAAGNAVVGVVIGLVFDPQNLNTPQYRSASQGRYAYVVDAPDVIFEVQEDSVGGAFPSDNVGLNANIVVGAGSLLSGSSGMQLQTSSAAVTATLPLKVIGFSSATDNEVGSPQSKLLVTINNHQLTPGTGSAGV